MDKRKQKLQDALKRKLTKEVKDHQDKLKNISSDFESSKKVQQKNDEKLSGLVELITALEKELDDAQCDYDTLDDACKYI